MTDAPRTPTPVDAVADAYLSTIARLDPLTATALGIPGHDGEMTDLSPEGHAARAQAARDVLASLDALAPADDVDTVTVEAMRFSLRTELDLVDAGEVGPELNVIDSPVQNLRDVFDLAPTATEQDWADVAARLNAVPDAVEGYIASLRLGVRQGVVAAARQVAQAAQQCDEQAGPDSFFPTFVAGAQDVLAGSPSAHAVQADLDRGVAATRAAYGRLATFLREGLAPHARAVDAVGRERYARASRYFVGAALDLDETYAWGLEELARVTAEQESVAREIAGPGAGVREAIAVLDADPTRRLDGTAALQAWMQATADAAIEGLDGSAFAITGRLRELECRIAPTQNGGIYYTGPSDDFSRPGRMWWSVPPDVTSFTTWREKTTVYHEGVPGHHLQVATAVANRGQLNAWRRLASWTSGHGEGWALYAERLMAELGFLDDPGDRLGMLDGQRMRAARVVFDIGVHLGLPAPAQYGGGTWDADSGWQLLVHNIAMAEPFLRFEWLRYLGWPGQAPSYKVGQRLWQQARDTAAAAAAGRGEAFDLTAFHARALAMGSVPLEVLLHALA